MNFIEPHNRSQFTFSNLEDLVPADNSVRLIDAFAEQLDLKRMGFEVKEWNREGQLAFLDRENIQNRVEFLQLR